MADNELQPHTVPSEKHIGKSAPQQDWQDGPSWMSRLPDDVLVSSLSIPGTHDSAAYTYNIPFVATQRMDISQQLNAGIRYFDLRCGLRADVLVMVHGPTLLGLRLEDVVQVMYDWLSKHKTEGLIVQLKKDRDSESSTMPFAQAVMDTLSTSPQYWRTVNTTPVLGDIRGRIQLFRRFRLQNSLTYGINVNKWQNNPLKPFTMKVDHGIQISVQDHYRYTEPVSLAVLVDQKVSEIMELLYTAQGNMDVTHWYINYTSALEFNWSYRYPPRTIAEGGWSSLKKVPGVNDSMRDALHVPRAAQSRCGIITMDFPDSNDELIAAIVASNHMKPQMHSRYMRFGFAMLCFTTCFLVWHILYFRHAHTTNAAHLKP